MIDNSANGPVFVVGIWRSGTSLLYTLLNQHPGIALLYEGDLPEFWPIFLIRGQKSKWLERWDLYNGGLSRHHIDPSSIPETISNIRAATQAVYNEYAKAKGAAVWGCKSPSYYGSLLRLARQFPDARFIIIWRDVQSTCSGIVRAGRETPWFRRPGIIHRALLGYRKMKVDSERLRAQGFQIHNVQYEELVSDPTAIMRGTCEFLGLPFDPQMVSLAGADRSAIYDGAHHSQVRGDSIRPPRQANDLPANLDLKAKRYLALWKRESQGTWPAYPKLFDISIAPPSSLERLTDAALFQCFRFFDRLTIFAFCFAPISFLKAYRGFKMAVVIKGQNHNSTEVVQHSDNLRA